MDLTELEVELKILLGALKIPSYKEDRTLLPKVSTQYIISTFGIILNGIYTPNYSQVLNALETKYPKWKYLFVSTDDDLFAIKEELIWEFIKSGYMHWLRFAHNRLFTNLIVESYGDKIIRHRLNLWEDKPEYNYWIELNTDALYQSKTFILSMDPGFFDNI